MNSPHRSSLKHVFFSTALLLAGLSAVPCARAQEPAAAPVGLTLEQASGRGTAPSFSASAPSARWAHDGKHVVLGRGDGARWLNPKTLKESDPQPRPETEKSDDTGQPSTKTLTRDLTEQFGALELLDLSSDGSVAGFVQNNDLFVFTRMFNWYRFQQFLLRVEPMILWQLSPEYAS